ncbi:MAG TPA: hypothetical protein VGR12_03705 [Solirubrobacteraceae bacterium]|nr:hypothetical protein [Solirubrobacteraceae bacterium]
MTDSLSARLVLLAAAAALALSLVWAVVAAEIHDVDGQTSQQRGVSELRTPAADEARAVPLAVRR